MRKYFLVIALGSLFGLASSSVDVVAQNGSSGTDGNIWVSVGWSYIDLPAVRKSSRNNSFIAPFKLQQRFTDHDGEMDDGWRVDAGARLFEFPMNGSQATVGVKGFYARFEDTQASQCEAATGSACTFFPLFQVDPDQNHLFLNGRAANTITSRDVDHWGAALEWASAGPMGGTAFAPRIGLAIKAIDQDIQLNYRDSFVIPQTATYDEDLETYYYGLYVGGETWFALGGGFRLGLDGEIGIYYARTDYDGTLSMAGNPVSTRFTQSLSLDNDEVAVVGSLKAELKNTIGMADFSLFAMADFYSYAPEMKYNELDIQGTQPTGTGGNTRTSIGDDEAWSATLGGKVTLRLN